MIPLFLMLLADPPAKLTDADIVAYWRARALGAEATASQLRAQTMWAEAKKALDAAQADYTAWVRQHCEPTVGPDNSITCPAPAPKTEVKESK